MTAPEIIGAAEHAPGCPAAPTPEEIADPCMCGDPPEPHAWHDVPEKYRERWRGAESPRPACTCKP